MALEILRLAGYDARAHLAAEQRLFKLTREDHTGRCLFYVCDPVIVLGSNNAAADWVHAELARADGVPLLRRFSGGGTVYLDRDVLNYSFIVPRDRLEAACRTAGLAGQPTTRRYIGLCRALVVDALAAELGPGFSATGISDISLSGRKISGNAQRIAVDTVLHHGTLLYRCPLKAIERYLPLPPNRPGLGHREFLTGLIEQGRDCTMAQLIDWLGRGFRTVFAPLAAGGG